LRGELPLVEEILRKVSLEATHNVLADHWEKFECARYRVSMIGLTTLRFSTYCPLPPVAMKRFLCSGW
jgi:hypothetical protein